MVERLVSFKNITITQTTDSGNGRADETLFLHCSPIPTILVFYIIVTHFKKIYGIIYGYGCIYYIPLSNTYVLDGSERYVCSVKKQQRETGMVLAQRRH